MNVNRLIMIADEPDAASCVQIACPRCSAPITFTRSHMPHIDECGFENYRLECQECGAPLAGIIDPADDALLLTDLAALRCVP
jgi:hypothetical protein